MIRVEPAPEPSDFDRDVRRPGLAAIAELVGEDPGRSRPGPKRRQVASRREDIPAHCFPPFWRKALPSMLTSYRRLCAYLALYIGRGTGLGSVDHAVPKSKSWSKVYEWSNYRLASALVNSRKREAEDVLDPFEIEDDWFALEFVEYQVKAGPGAVGEIRRNVEKTIERLRLNDPQYLTAREAYVENYRNGNIKFEYLDRRAPFIARELRRQNRLLEGDR